MSYFSLLMSIKRIELRRRATVADGQGRRAGALSEPTAEMNFRCLHSLIFIAEALKNEQTDRRGQIALFARTVDLRDQFRQRHLLGVRDFFQISPEGIFKTDAGLVPINYDGTFDDRGFHWAPRNPLTHCRYRADSELG